MSRVLPILFNTEMVRAIQDGRKTATRRVVKQAVWENFVCEGGEVVNWLNKKTDTLEGPVYKAPYQAGDILYVRETWCVNPIQSKKKKGANAPDGLKWHPSIHMPKQAARIWLKVTDVRAERLQEITEEQAKAEGAVDNRGFIHSPENEYEDIHSAKEHFKKIWDSTIKKPDIDRYGWDASPWVWVIEFERCEKPEPCIIKGINPASDKRPCIGYQKSKEDDEPCEMCKGCSVLCDGEDPEVENA